jgi:hypothetical protein
MQMHTKFDLPPGPAAVTDRLRLDGAFALTGAHFTSENIISKIDELSLRGQGKAAQANQEGADRKKTVAQNASAQNGSPQNGPAQNGAPQTTTPQTSPQPSSPANPPPATSSAADIAADMRGTFTFGSGKLAIPALDFRVPGADIAVQGAYTLQGQTLDFSGTARLDAHISQMVTGWKSLLLKPVDPFFAKDGAGTQVPIKISGTASHPDIGLNFKH